jgi:hypothetical protein
MAPPGSAKIQGARVCMLALLASAFLLLARIQTRLPCRRRSAGRRIHAGRLLGLATNADNAIAQAWQLACALPHANLPETLNPSKRVPVRGLAAPI